jgi:hypothetical protein
MELTIKHLAAYLPYGLKGLKISKGNFKTDPNIEEIIDLTISDIGAFLKKRYHVISCKPILRPLSMLDKEIEVNGERFVPIDWFEEKYYTLSLHKEYERLLEEDGYKWINHMSYLLIIHLLEWHFDIFGLIDAGLAVEMEDSHGR